MKKYYFTLLFALISGILPTTAQQKFCDLELSILSPLEGQIIPYGDTANLVYMIKNLGPDTLDLTDTIYFTIEGFPFTSSVVENLLPGDTVMSTFLSAWSDTTISDTLAFCMYLIQERNETINDSIFTNDTACVRFILEGRTTSIDEVNNKPVSIRLFPNPASQKVAMELVGFDALGTGSVIISDIAGKEWQRLDVQMKRNTSSPRVNLDISSLPTGIYLLEFRSLQNRAVQKLVIQ